MSSKASTKPVEDIIGYKFMSKPLLSKALTAARSEHNDHNGNRRLAQLGTALVEFLLVYISYRQNAPRDHTTRFKIRFSGSEHRAAIAKRTGIDSYISYSSKPGAKSPTVLAKSVNAIIAATFVDSRDIAVALRTMLRLGVLVEENGCINPRLLLLDQGEACETVCSIMNLLISGDFVDAISPSEGCIMPSQLFNDSGLNSPEIEDGTPCATVAENGHDSGPESNLERAQGAERFNILEQQSDQSDMADLTQGGNQDQNITCWPEASLSLNIQNKQSQAQANDIASKGITGFLSAQNNKGARSLCDNASPHGNATRKKRPAKSVESHIYPKKPSYALQTIGDRLTQYLLHKTEKCKAQGLRPPSETFFTPHIRERVLSLGNGTIGVLGMTMATITSAQSVVTLKETLQYKRAQTSYASCQLKQGLSCCDRIQIIEKLDQGIVYAHLLRRYHVLELFEECGGPNNGWNNGFVLATPLDFKQATRKSGNPVNNADSEVTKTMIHKCFPEVQQSTEKYMSKYQAIKRLRKLGERLHFVTTKFGRGVLGLLLDGVTVSRILAVSDTQFEEYVSILDTLQGATLREFNDAVSSLVHALLYGTLPDSETILERAEEKDILAFMTSSKGSTAAAVPCTHPIRLTAPSLSDLQELENAELQNHMGLLNSTSTEEAGEASLAPIVSGRVLRHKSNPTESTSGISQYGLLAGLSHVLASIDPKQELNLKDSEDPRLFFNVTSPSSTFICGSQGSGKSHTLSCMLENSLIPSKAGQLPHPLTGILFHYDTFISDTGGSPCEAAFLSSNDATTGVYSNFNIRVEPLQIDQKDLNTKRMQDLMAVNQEGGPMPLYMYTAKTILRDMRTQQQLTGTRFDYKEFKERLINSDLTPTQLRPLKQRLDTLQSFIPQGQANTYSKKRNKSLLSEGTDWEPKSGRLTIVDLSCPCISPDTACSLFNVCLEIFLEQDSVIGRVMALDKAYKYMNLSPEAYGFTNTLLSAVQL
ncbi:hypothetical protein TMEN_5052 [Trichophyton mentagrophytes]|nr:hypothetical protein TMEN_5052 [Trichophyton mentagrophytes]